MPGCPPPGRALPRQSRRRPGLSVHAAQFAAADEDPQGQHQRHRSDVKAQFVGTAAEDPVDRHVRGNELDQIDRVQRGAFGVSAASRVLCRSASSVGSNCTAADQQADAPWP